MAIRRPFNSSVLSTDSSTKHEAAFGQTSAVDNHHAREKRHKTSKEHQTCNRIDENMRRASIPSTCVAPEVVVPLRFPLPYCGWDNTLAVGDDFDEWEPVEVNIPSSITGRGNDVGYEAPMPPRRPLYRDQTPDQGVDKRQTSEKRAVKSEISMTGSWCELESAESAPNTPYPPIPHDWYPETSFDSRLSTPDLAPMSTHYEFCPCCSGDVEEDRINRLWYLGSKAKVEHQVADAMAYISMTRGGSSMKDCRGK